MITKTSDHIKIEGHVGTWYVIDAKIWVGSKDWDERLPERMPLYLLEHEQCGDEVPCLIVDENGTVILDDVWNGFDGFEYDGWTSELKMPKLINFTE